jgi:hypothetical protein
VGGLCSLSAEIHVVVVLEVQEPVVRGELGLELIQFARRIVRRARDYELELLAWEVLLLNPRPDAGHCVPAVLFERDDHGKPRRSNARRLALGCAGSGGCDSLLQRAFGPCRIAGVSLGGRAKSGGSRTVITGSDHWPTQVRRGNLCAWLLPIDANGSRWLC